MDLLFLALCTVGALWAIGAVIWYALDPPELR